MVVTCSSHEAACLRQRRHQRQTYLDLSPSSGMEAVWLLGRSLRLRLIPCERGTAAPIWRSLWGLRRGTREVHRAGRL